MKSRLLIIIGIIVTLVSVVTFVMIINMHESNLKEYEIIDELTYMSSDELLQRVLNHCEFQRKLATGEIPERNADGSYNVIDAVFLTYQNGTHYINNNTCEWQIIETGTVIPFLFEENRNEPPPINLSEDMLYQECAELFDEIYQEYLNRPIPECELPNRSEQCEPLLLKHFLRSNEEFAELECPLYIKDWAYLTKNNDLAWQTISSSTDGFTPTEMPIPEPDTGEFRYGLQECQFIDANGEPKSCDVEGWTKPASELDCEEICRPPGGTR